MTDVALIIAVAAAVCIAAWFMLRARARPHYDTIRAAIGRLLARPSGAILIIEDPRSGKFVQFAGSREEPLLLDLPSQTLSPEETITARGVFADHGYPGPETYPLRESPGGPVTRQQTSFVVEFASDIDKAAELAVAILRDVYGLEKDARLKLTEE